MFNSKLFLTASSMTLVIISALLSLRFRSIPLLDHQLQGWEIIPIDGGAVGPESFAFDPVGGGGPYTGVSDGRIIKWEASQRGWIDFAVTSPNREGCVGSTDYQQMEHICGRPLGLNFDSTTGNLYITDAYLGLFVVGPDGGLATKLTSKAQFTNGLDIDQTTGTVYFTGSSQRYPRRNYMSIIFSGDSTGSLMKYNPESKEVTVLLNNLSFPNGVALSQDGRFILVAETTNCRILRLWLKPPKAGILEVFAKLPGFPDNIKRNGKGEFWVAIHSRRGKVLKWILSNPWIGNTLSNLSICTVKMSLYISKLIGQGLAIKLREDGEILEMFEDRNGKRWKHASEVMEKDGYLWIGSVINPFLVKHKIYHRQDDK